MIKEEQIIAALRKIDQGRFERLIDNLFNQGAFPDIVPPSSFLESFGVNIELQRTRKAPSHADAEIRRLDVKIEKSVDGDWARKFKADVQKHKADRVKKFLFCTNQDTFSKTVRVNGEAVSAEGYCKEELQCEDCVIIGSSELVSRLGDPKFSHLRRQFLEIPEEHFYTPAMFLQSIRSNPGYQTSVEASNLQEYGFDLAQILSSAPRELTILHGDDYIALLYALGIWAENESKGERAVTRDHCFINWPAPNAPLQGVDHRELSTEVDSYLYVWGANDIANLHEYLKFWRTRTSLIFVTPTAFKDKVATRLNSSGPTFDIRYVTLPSLDRRTIAPQELLEHDSKLRTFMVATIHSLKRLEALIYFYSPVYLSDEQSRERICALMNIEEVQFGYLTELLLQSKVAAVTGNIIWLKQPSVARTLLNDFITGGVFTIESLV